jgi:hypothetical protein
MSFLVLFILYRIHISHGHFEAFADQHVSGSAALAVGPSNWNEAIDVIDYGSPDQVVCEIA